LVKGTLDATKKSAEAAKQSADAATIALHANRPYLLITGIDMIKEDIADQKILRSFNPILHNFGQSPADIVDYICHANIVEDRKPNEPIIEYTEDENERIKSLLPLHMRKLLI